jgi:hypothetical protein
MASFIARQGVISPLPSIQADSASLQELMANYPCYAFVPNEDQSGARALFRGRWRLDQVAPYLKGEVKTMIVNDERASGFKRFRLYGLQDDCPVCLAEIEIYFARGDGRTSFWCQTEAETGALGLAA